MCIFQAQSLSSKHFYKYARKHLHKDVSAVASLFSPLGTYPHFPLQMKTTCSVSEVGL